MTKRELRALNSALAKIESTKKKMADLRDVLRGQLSDLEDIAESLSEGVNLVEDGLRAISDGVDEMSKFV